MGMHAGGRRRFVVPPELGYVGGVGDGEVFVCVRA